MAQYLARWFLLGVCAYGKWSLTADSSDGDGSKNDAREMDVLSIKKKKERKEKRRNHCATFKVWNLAKPVEWK